MDYKSHSTKLIKSETKLETATFDDKKKRKYKVPLFLKDPLQTFSVLKQIVLDPKPRSKREIERGEKVIKR